VPGLILGALLGVLLPALVGPGAVVPPGASTAMLSARTACEAPPADHLDFCVLTSCRDDDDATAEAVHRRATADLIVLDLAHHWSPLANALDLPRQLHLRGPPPPLGLPEGPM
jgi:hypothetical protein